MAAFDQDNHVELRVARFLTLCILAGCRSHIHCPLLLLLCWWMSFTLIHGYSRILVVVIICTYYFFRTGVFEFLLGLWENPQVLWRTLKHFFIRDSLCSVRLMSHQSLFGYSHSFCATMALEYLGDRTLF